MNAILPAIQIAQASGKAAGSKDDEQATQQLLEQAEAVRRHSYMQSAHDCSNNPTKR